MLTGCDSMPGRPKPADLPIRPSAITDFPQLYAANCAGCHGVDGKNGAAIAINNPLFLFIIDDATMRGIIANGVPGTAMPPFVKRAGGELTDKQVEILIHGIRKSWQVGYVRAGAPPYATAESGNPNEGAKVYATNCQSCHGLDGKGGPTAGSIVDPAYLSLVSDQYLRAIIIAGRPDTPHPNYTQYPSGQPLYSKQIADLVAWLSAKRPPIPGSIARRQ
jgi:cytochrome c oxidase cbb3-type subunit 3/ubiquinol-cytochrome c reductase cytochrome c subunit